MGTLGIILVFVVPMIATVPVAALLCRHRLARKRQISYGTMFTAASVIPFMLALGATCIEPSMWWSREHKSSPQTFVVLLALMAAMCVLPALCVVVYYQRRENSDETPGV